MHTATSSSEVYSRISVQRFDERIVPRFFWLLLRLAALAGLLLYFFQLDKRTEQRVVRDSRVAVLVDTSLSMSLPGTPSEIGVSSTQTRSAEAASLLARYREFATHEE